MPRKVKINENQADKNLKKPKSENQTKCEPEKKSENQTKCEKLDIADKITKEERLIVRLKEIKNIMVTKHFEPREMLAFSQLRTLNQKELIQSLDQNDKLGIVIKDKLQVAMISMEKFEYLVELVQEYGRLLEWLEEQELFKRIEHRLDNPVWEELPEGKSLWEWAGLEEKG